MPTRDEQDLGVALEVFAIAHKIPRGWATRTMSHLIDADIITMEDFACHCKNGTINDELRLYGAPEANLLDETTTQSLITFLPGPCGCQCFRVVKRAAEKVAKGSATSNYVNRPRDGSKGDERWHVPAMDDWIVNVDCAGFVRNAIEHASNQPCTMSLSDRDFMRAKDFYCFFSTLPFTVMDVTPQNAGTRKWRIVDDLRMVLPGDVLAYRPSGNAAGGAAFTEADRQDLHHMLLAVKTASLWNDLRMNGTLITRNVANDPLVQEWVSHTEADLAAVGIVTMKDLYENMDAVNSALSDQNLNQVSSEILDLIKECHGATAESTGHIVFVSGPAVRKRQDEYRIRVVHSTKYGKPLDNGNVSSGVQEYYRRFLLRRNEQGIEFWTRESTDLRDELAGQGKVQVIAARMCF